MRGVGMRQARRPQSVPVFGMLCAQVRRRPLAGVVHGDRHLLPACVQLFAERRPMVSTVVAALVKTHSRNN
jgi:hypothetical protein